jgi:protein TonB
MTASALPFPVALAPSTRGIGPNTYLGSQHFKRTLIIALVAHAAFFAVYGLLPEEAIRDIPVRALSFKLGPRAQIAAFAPAPTVAPPVMTATPMPAAPAPAPKVEQPPPPASAAKAPGEWKATTAPKPKPKPAKKLKPAPKIVKEEEFPRQRPAENMASYQPVEQALLPMPALDIPPPPAAPDYAALAPAARQEITPPAARQETPPPKGAEGLPKFSEVSNLPEDAAIAETPHRYVRDYGMPSYAALTQQAASPEGSVSGEGAENTVPTVEEEIRARYEQQISAWIAQHKIYPVDAGDARGRVIVRVRVDRQGFVRYYAVEKGSGNSLLDRAAIEMVRRANPVPSVPENYPAGNLIEFLIPITFEAPGRG